LARVDTAAAAPEAQPDSTGALAKSFSLFDFSCAAKAAQSGCNRVRFRNCEAERGFARKQGVSTTFF
jgi:hypothetical protein